MKPIAIASLLAVCAVPTPALADDKEDRNRNFIADAFAAWAQGEGDVFSLLTDDATWHITGLDPAVARTYRSRQALLDATAKPLGDRLSGPIKPVVRRIWADGDDVLVHWDGTAPLRNGSQYRNTYLWVLTVKDRRIVASTAFLDNAAFKAALEGRK